ncbi:MAG: amidase [Candidatus Acidiferrales bacterium]
MTRALENELGFLTIEEAADLLRRKKISPVELVEDALARIARIEPRLNAFITVTAEQARRAARRAEREIMRGGARGALHGIPITLKDNIETRGVRTTAGSKILARFVPKKDAAIAERLARAGAILLGKTNLHEFAYGVTTENPHYGATRNPWAGERIAGGSSGGSAAALAAGIGFASVGTDTGGSIRIPAALCGIVGLKPTYGRVSCRGVVPLARTFDVAGPLARTARDAAMVLGTIAGADAQDSATVEMAVPNYGRVLRGRLRGLRIGWPREYFFERVDGEVLRALEEVARTLGRLGAKVRRVSLPNIAEGDEPSTQIALAEATEFHEGAGWFPARAKDYGADVRKRLELGARVTAVQYMRSLEKRKIVSADFAAAFEKVDAILAPVTPIAAPRRGEKSVKIGGREESVRATLIRMNRPANFAGLPATSVPCGFTREGLPMGMQLIGRAWEEATLLRIAHAFEQATEWHLRRPALDSFF